MNANLRNIAICSITLLLGSCSTRPPVVSSERLDGIVGRYKGLGLDVLIRVLIRAAR